MKQINAYSHMVLGSELTNLDDEINKNIGDLPNKIKSLPRVNAIIWHGRRQVKRCYLYRGCRTVFPCPRK